MSGVVVGGESGRLDVDTGVVGVELEGGERPGGAGGADLVGEQREGLSTRVVAGEGFRGERGARRRERG